MCGGDGFARVRQITEAQQQVADRLAHQRGLSLLPSDGQTYRPCQDRGLIAQVAGRGRAFEGFTGAEINSLACTRLSILWEKMGAWSWSTPPTNILSKRESQAALRLNLYGQWSLQYVKYLAKYSRCFTYQRCNASFPKAYRLQRHKRSCEAKVRRVYSVSSLPNHLRTDRRRRRHPCCTGAEVFSVPSHLRHRGVLCGPRY